MLKITGYSDKYQAFPGEKIKFYINSEQNENYDEIKIGIITSKLITLPENFKEIFQVGNCSNNQ